MVWLKTFLISLIMAVFDKVFKSSKATAEDGKGPGELEKSLQDQIKKDGWE